MNLPYWKEVTASCLLLIVVNLYTEHRQMGKDIGLSTVILTKQLDYIKEKHRLLLAKYELLSKENKYLHEQPQKPSVKYEETRRRIYTNIKELWYYARHAMERSLKGAKATASTVMEDIKHILRDTRNRKMSLMSDLEQMATFDGWHKWRQVEATKVSHLVQTRFHRLANPHSCSKVDWTCKYEDLCTGSGCLLHQIVLCLIHAYGTKQSVIFDAVSDRIFSVIKPISKSCKSSDSQYFLQPFDQQRKFHTLERTKKGQFHSLLVPKDLALRVQKFNGDPASWWVGQVLKFALKVQPDVQKDIKAFVMMNFKRPIVGVHIRRTDKVYDGEAAFHKLSEYMIHVKDYFDQLELTKKFEVRRVFLATDDIEATKEATRNYPQYKFFYNKTRILSAIPNMQKLELGMKGAMVDLHLLSMCDYIVCTFSSNMCRKAYEMMQANRVDASNSFVSLDDVYQVGGQTSHFRKAVMSHQGGYNEISFEAGDLIAVTGNHWTGYGEGRNEKTKKNGLFPWYKTMDQLDMYEFPVFKDVPNENQDVQNILVQNLVNQSYYYY